jgi:hypothetical protein
MKKHIIKMGTVVVCAASLYADDYSMMAQDPFSKEVIPTVSIEPLSVFNLNFNKQGNIVVARASEKIFSTLNFSGASAFVDPDALYQIVIGYEDVGPQKCIFNELGYRFEGKDGILSFFCEAPEMPGVYEVQCRISSARSSAEALQGWWDQKGMEYSEKVDLGKIVVK